MRDVQQDSLPTLLIVDDDPSIRTTMLQVLTEVGYSVRSAQDGFSALAEIQKEIPAIILSDLNMPGMSGFELLSLVRLRFPSIRLIAMSGAFSGDEVPSGVVADAFYQKGSGIRSLLKIIVGLVPSGRRTAIPPAALAPIWVQRNGNDAPGRPFVLIACPDCLRTFQQTVGGSLSPIREAHCVHCRNTVYYAIVEPVDAAPAQPPQTPHRKARPLASRQLNR